MNAELCTGCSACASVCPRHAISMRRKSDGFSYPLRDEALCDGCGLCESVCPLTREKQAHKNRYFAVRSRNLTQRLQSSSGGVFRLLAEGVLSQNGAVFGAAFDGAFRVRQTLAESGDALVALLGTKYVQSDPADSFAVTAELLGKGRRVLYSGSPCTVHGLLCFLDGERAGLLTVDHICYGVPSSGFWEAYTAYLAKDGTLERFCFRDKRRPNSGHTLSYTVSGTEHTQSLNENRWCRLFFKNISLRSSCLSCRYCTAERASDLTIGDFWGIEKCRPEMDDGYGVSLVITHSEKGEAALEGILPLCDWHEVSAEQAYQPRLSECAKAPILRKLFFAELARAGGAENCDMEMLLKKYGA